MKKILVAVDFSDASITAVRQALVLAEALDSVVMPMMGNSASRSLDALNTSSRIDAGRWTGTYGDGCPRCDTL